MLIFEALNQITVFDIEPMPDVDAIFAKLMDHMYFARLDLSEGYWQVPFCSSFGSFSDPLSLYSSL